MHKNDLEATTRIVHALTICAGDSQLLPYLNAYFQFADEALSFERAVGALLASRYLLCGTLPLESGTTKMVMTLMIRMSKILR